MPIMQTMLLPIIHISATCSIQHTIRGVVLSPTRTKRNTHYICCIGDTQVPLESVPIPAALARVTDNAIDRAQAELAFTTSALLAGRDDRSHILVHVESGLVQLIFAAFPSSQCRCKGPSNSLIVLWSKLLH